MKLLILCALLATSAYAAPKPQSIRTDVKLGSLIDDLLEFVALIPVDQLKDISDKYLKEDKEFCDVVRYLQGSDWAALVEDVRSRPEVQELNKYLTDAGLPIDLIVELIHELIQNAQPQAVQSHGLKTLRNYLDEIEAALPVDKLKALLEEKMQTSEDFKALYAKISSDKAHNLVEEVRALPEVQRIAAKLISLGVRVEEALAKIYEFLGWGAPKVATGLKSLIDDLLEFVALIPIDQLKDITDKYLKEDKEFCDVVRYLQGSDWAALVEDVRSRPEVQELNKYLTDAGLPIDLIVELIHELIQNAQPQAVQSHGLKTLRNYLDEIEAALPVDKLKALLEEKMQTSEDFKALYAKISSDKAHNLVEEVRALPEVQRIAAKLISLGVRVEEALAKIYEFLGWGAPKVATDLKSLIDDLLEFVALIPIDQLKDITDKYLKEDKEFCDVVRYLQGSDWAALVEDVRSRPEVQELNKYLTDAGLPIDLIVELIHELIQNAQPQAVQSHGLKTLRNYLDEIEAALPVDKLKALLEDKMETSEDFKALYAKISSDKAHNLVEEVRALPEVQRIAAKLISLGVRVEEALAKIYEFLGWGAPKVATGLKSLIDDLLEFVALIPIDQLKDITDKYLKEDKEFCDVVRYLQGSDWAALVEDVRSRPEVQELNKYLTDAGLPIDLIVELIHELIQNAQPQAVQSHGLKTLRNYLDEIEAALPVDKLKALLEDKMQTSEDFKALYAKISSDKAHNLVEEVRALPEVQRIAAKLISLGVRVEEALAEIYEFLGWGKP